MAKEKEAKKGAAPEGKGGKPAAAAQGGGGKAGGGDKRGDKGGKKGRDADRGGDEPAKAKGPAVERRPIARMLERYRNDVVPRLREQFGYGNPNQVPRVVKVVVNMGLGEAVQNGKVVDAAVEELRTITGQAPVTTRARKSIATFKLRQGMRIGAMVTLRGERMWEFLDRLLSLALPRVRDFRGVSTKAFDGRGNYTLGVKEEIIFPEINYDKLDRIRGLNISIVTTAKTDEESLALLRHLGMPFSR